MSDNQLRPNPFLAPNDSRFVGATESNQIRQIVLLVWIVSLLLNPVLLCTLCYFDGAYCREAEPPELLEFALICALIVSLISPLIYPATIGGKILQFAGTIVVLIALIYFALFFSMFNLGFDIMD